MRFNATSLERLRLELEREFDRLDDPQEPKRVFARATSALPPAADYRHCVAFDTTLGVLVTSDGANWVS